jgi:molecular chaperone DnaK (HSP70)
LNFDSIRYIIGIDLGTTNSAVSYVDLSIEEKNIHRIRIFDILQLTGPSEISRLNMLPSFLYIPGKYDIAESAIRLPWATENDNFVGAYARDQGIHVPGRLVFSAKSWLCHGDVDRKAAILPWGADDEVKKISPVGAAAAYLYHIKKAWNSLQEDEDLFLQNQLVIVTVPASFDEVARDLTLEAAEKAGLRHVTLLEEPLAAFYSWLAQHEDDWDLYVKPDDGILVCDVGGGTTDLTLVALKEEIHGSPRFERIAVGDHLLLGGDNIDMALARMLEQRLGGSMPKLGADRWKSLCSQCRLAKEQILENREEKIRITLIGQGSRLIAGTLSVDLNRSDVENIVLNTFFPVVDSGPALDPEKETSSAAFGLPYEPVRAVTRQIGWFLERHQDDISKRLNKTRGLPEQVLFNGGSLKSGLIQNRIIHSLTHWFKANESESPRILDNAYPELAVALGAAYYGLVKIGEGVRVGSGSPRGYYLGVAPPEAGEPAPETKHAICLVERGLEEGSAIALEGKQFDVLVNQPVRFDLYSSSYRSGDCCGDLVEVDDSLTLLPPIRTVVQFGQKKGKTVIPVQVEAEYTEVGALALWCRSLSTPHRWKLQFELRKTPLPMAIADETVFDATVVEKIQHLVKSALLSQSDTARLESLVKDVKQMMGQSKTQWPLGLIRSMTDTLLENTRSRKTTPEHESRWLNLTGFCMRPGFGEGFDEHRIKKIWKIHGQGPLRPNHARVRSEWWILWRRIAGGLNAGQQRQFTQDAAQWIGSRKIISKKLSPQERIEIWMAIASMERIQVEEKVRWGRQLISETGPGQFAGRQLWSLARIGARTLLYGSTDRVIRPDEAWAWIRDLIQQKWNDPKPAIYALVQMARKTGDRTRDIDDRDRQTLMDWMLNNGAESHILDMLKNAVAIEKQEKNMLFGDELPAGLLLRND